MTWKRNLRVLALLTLMLEALLNVTTAQANEFDPCCEALGLCDDYVTLCEKSNDKKREIVNAQVKQINLLQDQRDDAVKRAVEAEDSATLFGLSHGTWAILGALLGATTWELAR